LSNSITWGSELATIREGVWSSIENAHH
jgi:hypothetical protein